MKIIDYPPLIDAAPVMEKKKEEIKHMQRFVSSIRKKYNITFLMKE